MFVSSYMYTCKTCLSHGLFNTTLDTHSLPGDTLHVDGTVWTQPAMETGEH